MSHTVRLNFKMDFRYSHYLDNVLTSMYAEYGPIDHQLNQVNEFYSNGIHNIFDSDNAITVSMKPIDSEAEIYDTVNCKIYFKNIIMETPSTVTVNQDSPEPVFPTETLAKRGTYASNIRADILFQFFGVKDGISITTFEKTLENRGICTMPVIVGSLKCNTFGLSDRGMRLRNEDPTYPGGYYIIKGQEYYINTTEASAPNVTKVFRGTESSDYITKAEFTARDGFDNQASYRVTTVFGTDKNIYVIMYCGIFRENVKIPLPVFITALGLVRPFKETINKICYGKEQLENIVQTCWYNYEDFLGTPEKAIANAREYIANLIPDSTRSKIPIYQGGPSLFGEAFVGYVTRELQHNFEQYCFTMLGKTRSSSLTKLDYIYRMVYWTIAAGLSSGNELIDNRDISIIKRFVSPATTVAKVTKTVYRHTIIPSFRLKIREAIRTTPFEKIDPEKLFRNKQKDIADEFQKSITQAINAGGDIKNATGNVVAKGQMKIGMAQHKNALCIIAQARAVDGNSFGDNTVTTSSRNKEFRRNEQSLTGGICPIQSATESSNVGTKKQLAISTRIAKGESDHEIIELLEKHAKELGISLIDPLNCDPLRGCIIFVNGKIIGKTGYSKMKNQDDFDIIRMFNKFKREGKIPRMTSVTYCASRNEINFFTDGGRLVRPVIPVIRTKDGKEVPGGTPGAKQIIPITLDDLDPKTINFSQLLEEGKVVYLATDEAPTYRVATCYEEWIESLDSPVDHFDFIEIPSGIFSLAVASKPFLRHDKVARTVYQSSQSRQTAGKNVENIYLRYDKEMVTQFYTSIPTVRTLLPELGIKENGENIWLAVMQTTSDNQEDSIIMRKGAIDCGAFSNVKFDSRRIPVDSKEILGINPDIKISAIKGAAQNPFVNIDPATGVAVRGTRIGADPVVVVAKSVYTAETVNGVIKNETKDRSYSTNNKHEIEYVDHTNKCEIDGVVHVQISTVKSRNIEIGDKGSTRAGQKGIVGKICENNEMPYTLSGIQPDFLINPHHQNTRVTIGMIYEGIFASLGSKLGIYIKGNTVPEAAFFMESSDLEHWIEEELRPQYRNYPKKDAEKYISATRVAIKELRSQLEEGNWDVHTMVSGLNGEIVQGEVAVVRIYYQRLLKVVKDAFYVANDTVNYDVHFRQPDAGAKNSGGLRNGEMETGNLMGHGSANFLGEKTHMHSDGLKMYLCRCGRQANYNHETKTSFCYHCREKTDMVEMQSAFSTQLLIDKLAGTGVNLMLVPENYRVYDVVTPK